MDDIRLVYEDDEVKDSFSDLTPAADDPYLPIPFVSADIAAALAETGIEITTVGLRFDKNLSFEDWQKVGSLLLFVYERAQVALRFALGDWYLYGLKWGEKAESVATCLPDYRYHTVRQYGYVAEHYQFDTRVSNWTWRMYRDLAAEDDQTRAYVLSLPLLDAKKEIARLQVKRTQTPALLPDDFMGGGKTVEEVQEVIREMLQPLIGETLTEERLAKAVKVLTGQTTNIHVSDETYEWYTPLEYVEAARAVMGEIDLDPASSPLAQEKIKARQFFTREEDGLQQAWTGRVWLNPPYDAENVQRFITKAVSEYEAGRIEQAVLLVNNATETQWFQPLLSQYSVCFTRGRIAFWNPELDTLAARQGQAFIYLGGVENWEFFKSVFSRFGAVVCPL